MIIDAELLASSANPWPKLILEDERGYKASTGLEKREWYAIEGAICSFIMGWYGNDS